jgi:Heavy metal binding domain
MKQYLISFTVVTASILAACHGIGSGKANKAVDSTFIKGDSIKLTSQTKYTCTMHPEVISDTAGHCPKCGMDLVPVTDSSRNK